MTFEVFERDVAAPEGPLVAVGGTGQVMFNRAAWDLVLMQGVRAADAVEVVLLFDAETRTAAVQPAVSGSPETARWRFVQQRSMMWPVRLDAQAFVERHRVARGEYPAGLAQGPGPRMVTFEVGAPTA